MGTILIQQFRPSVCLSVTIRNCIKTAKCRSIYRPEMVEIISPPDSPVILAFGQLIAVTKFGRRSPLLRQILERYCAILSRIVRGLCQKRCKNSYNSGPFKSIVCPLSSGGYFHQSCHVTKACVSLHWHQRRQTLPSSSSRRLKECVVPPAMCRRRRVSPWCISATSAKFPLIKCGKWWHIRQSKVQLSTETVNGRRLKIGDNWS